MGYHTDFDGAFTVTPTLTPEHAAYLRAFNETRRMQRDADRTASLPDPVREAVGLPVGREGGYFVGAGGFMGQNAGPDVIDSNGPPSGQPGLWCQWTPSDDLTAIEWDGNEKFYNYVEWIEYLIEHFLRPWGYVLNGSVEWFGEIRSDIGTIVITDNVVGNGRVRSDDEFDDDDAEGDDNWA